MKHFYCFIISIFLIITHSYSQKFEWTNLGEKLPNTISTVTISGIDMVGDSIWIISGYGNYQNGTAGEIYFSADRGKTFTIQTTKYGTHGIKMQDSKRGWACGVEGQIYYTSDGGSNWIKKYSASRTLMAIDFPNNSDTGICVGFNGIVKTISDKEIKSIPMENYVSNIYSVSCIDSRHAFVAGEEIIGPIIDAELQIDQSYPGTNGIYAINMVDSLHGWCVGSPTAAGAWDSAGCMIIHTIDGHNWTDQVNPVKGKSGTLMAVKALNKMEAWTVGTSGVILHTTDGGENWKREAEGLSKEMLYGIYVVSPEEVYITGNNRTFLRGIISSSVNEKGNEKVAIYPNPCNDYINIENCSDIIIPKVIIIYNSLGEKILESTTQSNIERINLDGLNSGCYFLKIDNECKTFIKD